MSKLIINHLMNSRKLLKAYGKAIGIAKHSVNLGNAREALISNFLSQNLPTAIDYSSGEIFDCNGNRSGQIDILLTPNTSPKLYLHGAINLVPADTLLAAIEVKSNLTTGENSGLSTALSSCYKVKALVIANEGRHTARTANVSLSAVPFMIFAYKGYSSDAVMTAMQDSLEKNNKSMADAPDLITVLEENYYLIKTERWHHNGVTVKDVYRKSSANDPVLLASYELLIGLVEYWSQNPGKFSMPLDKYTKDMPSLLDLL